MRVCLSVLEVSVFMCTVQNVLLFCHVCICLLKKKFVSNFSLESHINKRAGQISKN